jgi:PKD repeat protein
MFLNISSWTRLCTALAFAATLAAATLHAQAPQRCATDAHWTLRQAENPDLARSARQLEQTWALQSQQVPPTRSIRKIPVVVHLIQSSQIERISDARVQSQIDVLNEDYRRLNADTTNIPAIFQGVAADTEIEFCLATIDPNGCPTTGINRIISPAYAMHNDNQETQLKALIQWNPRMYLNMWVPEDIVGLLGYATFPSSLNFSPQLDGVVINGGFFGRGFGTPPSSFALGRTTTHEVGHWLGLFHTFQGGCAGTTATNCTTGGDGICDTPPSANSNFGCPGSQNTCTETPTDLPDQTTNYMDYGDDPCLNLFTQGQQARMFFYLDNLRAQVWSPSNLSATGCDGSVSPGCAPVAAFSSSLRSACVGSPVRFQDRSTGPPSSWQWTFQGGNPASDTSANPVVTYSQAGVYPVGLTISNAFGTDTETQAGWITVLNAVSAPNSEGFEASASNLPTGWDVEDEDNQGSWQLTATSASAGQNSALLPLFSLLGAGSHEVLITHPYDLSQLGAATFTYDRAYKRRSGFAIDSLSISASTDCGETWTVIRRLAGGTLATVPGLAVSTSYLPLPTDWKTDTLDLSPFTGNNGVKLKFDVRNGGGQNLYLDQLNLDGIVGVASPSRWSPQLDILPNPSASAPEIRYILPRPAAAKIQLCAMDGRVYWQVQQPQQPAGEYLLQLPDDLFEALPAGMYLVQFQTPEGQATKRMLKLHDH